MSRWYDHIEWFWLFFIILVVTLGVGDAIERRQGNELIQACISQNKSAVIENNALKECK